MIMDQNITKFLKTFNDLLEVGSNLAKSMQNHCVIFLSGPLGAGKTTLVRGLLQGLGIQEKVKSPTYTLVEPYEIAGKTIFHFDLYRIHDPNELKAIGIEEYFSESAICLVEWPEHGFPFLPQPDITCYIRFKDEGREVRIEASTVKGEAMLERLNFNKGSDPSVN